MKTDNKLYFPTRISLKKELWKGFGSSETRRFLIVVGITIPLAIALVLIFKLSAFIAVIFSLSIFAITITCLQRMDNYISIYTYLKLILEFYRNQQTFYYNGGAK